MIWFRLTFMSSSISQADMREAVSGVTLMTPIVGADTEDRVDRLRDNNSNSSRQCYNYSVVASGAWFVFRTTRETCSRSDRAARTDAKLCNFAGRVKGSWRHAPPSLHNLLLYLLSLSLSRSPDIPVLVVNDSCVRCEYVNYLSLYKF